MRHLITVSLYLGLLCSSASALDVAYTSKFAKCSHTKPECVVTYSNGGMLADAFKAQEEIIRQRIPIVCNGICNSVVVWLLDWVRPYSCIGRAADLGFHQGYWPHSKRYAEMRPYTDKVKDFLDGAWGKSPLPGPGMMPYMVSAADASFAGLWPRCRDPKFGWFFHEDEPDDPAY